MNTHEECQRIGLVVELASQVELYLTAIIEAYILPRDDRQAFFRSHVLNNAIVSLGSKVKIVQAINRDLEIISLDANALHKVAQLRNAFAHNDIISGIRVDGSAETEVVTYGLESIKGNGELLYISRDEAFEQFKRYHKIVESNLREMLGKMRA